MTRVKHMQGPLRVDPYYGDNGKTQLYRLQATVGITADGILRRADADLYAAAPQLLVALEILAAADMGEPALHAKEYERQVKEIAAAAINLITGD